MPGTTRLLLEAAAAVLPFVEASTTHEQVIEAMLTDKLHR
jgi:hypothetical protein